MQRTQGHPNLAVLPKSSKDVTGEDIALMRGMGDAQEVVRYL
jgi:hypothetical protein